MGSDLRDRVVLVTGGGSGLGEAICRVLGAPFILDRFPETDPALLQSPDNVFVLTQPAETVIPEVMLLPMRETSWP